MPIKTIKIVRLQGNILTHHTTLTVLIKAVGYTRLTNHGLLHVISITNIHYQILPLTHQPQSGSNRHNIFFHKTMAITGDQTIFQPLIISLNIKDPQMDYQATCILSLVYLGYLAKCLELLQATNRHTLQMFQT